MIDNDIAATLPLSAVVLEAPAGGILERLLPGENQAGAKHVYSPSFICLRLWSIAIFLGRGFDQAKGQ
jgi:hypothetical protein